MENEKRLIDANDLIERLKFKKKISEVGLHRGLQSAMSQCDKAPTVDAVEVVHGRWVQASETMPIYRCSICKERNLFKNGNNVLSNYCPNCGAKMDGERKDNERKAD